MQWAVQDSQRFCLRINFAWDQRDSIGEVVARWNDFNSQQFFFFAKIEFIFLIAPTTLHIPVRLVWKDETVEIVSFDQSPASTSLCPVLTRPTRERICTFFRGKKPRLFFLTNISYGRTTHRTQCLFPIWMNRRVLMVVLKKVKNLKGAQCFSGPLLMRYIGSFWHFVICESEKW